MPRFKLLSIAAVLCMALSGCLSLLDVLTRPDPPESHSTSPTRPAVTVPSQPQPAVNLDFRITDAQARISGNDYVLDVAERPVITALGGDTYRLDLRLRRKAKSSWRGDETLRTHFYYDGAELIFFADTNGNHRFDRREANVRHVITHTQEIVSDGDKHYLQARSLEVSLRAKHLDSWQRVKTLTMRLVFVGGR